MTAIGINPNNPGCSLLASGLYAASSAAVAALSYHLYETMYETSLDYAVPLAKAIWDGHDTVACAIIEEHPSALSARSLRKLGGKSNTDSDLAVVRCIPEDVRLSIDTARAGLHALEDRGSAVAHGELMARTTLSEGYGPAVGRFLDQSAKMLRRTASDDSYKAWLSASTQKHCATDHLFGQLALNGLEEGIQAVERCYFSKPGALGYDVLALFKQSLSQERYIDLLKAEVEAGHYQSVRALVKEGEYKYLAEKLSASEGGKPAVYLFPSQYKEIIELLGSQNEYNDELVAALVAGMLAAGQYEYPAYVAMRSALKSYLEQGNTDAFVKLSNSDAFVKLSNKLGMNDPDVIPASGAFQEACNSICGSKG